MDHGASWNFWHLLTRLGEAGIVLPIALAVAAWLAWGSRQPRSAVYWLVPIFVAASLTTITKIAFMGWGIGSATLDFTGISGHTMFSTAIYPVILRAFVGDARKPWPAVGVVAGYALAVLVAVSRIEVHAHSWSEVIAGLITGGTASACALVLMHRNPPWLSSPIQRLLLGAVGCWLVVMPVNASPSITHDVVTRVAVRLANRDEPYRREDLFRAQARSRAAATASADNADTMAATVSR